MDVAMNWDEWVPGSQAGRIIGQSREAAKDLAHKGIVRSQQTPLGILLHRGDLERVARERKHKAQR